MSVGAQWIEAMADAVADKVIQRLRGVSIAPTMPRAYTVQEAADVIGISKRTLEGIILRKEIEIVKYRRSVRITEDSLKRYIDCHKI
jgi:excisionase family DNA binding protein